MSRNQRLSFLGIAAVIAVVAIVVLTTGGDSADSEDTADTAATATATPSATPSADDGSDQTPTPTPTPTATPKPLPPLLVAGKVAKLRFKEGETVRFRIRSDKPEHVHIHGYDIMKDVAPGKTANVAFKGDITGIFEIEFEDSAQEIAELRVDPE